MTENEFRYTPLQVALHWSVFWLLIAEFVVGKVSANLPNGGVKLSLLAIHATLGVLILIAMLARLVLRAKSPAPPHASAGNPFFDWLAKATHIALYLFTILMALSGMTLSLQAGLLPAVFSASAAALPADFFDFTARATHGFIAPVLLALIVLHIVGAFYHQLIVKDNLISRMGRER
ncbi:MAG: cytochrome b/b6 domain-containing protein [Anaerolineales bacterium]|nr:cytochrome b/b6 domain-containing protein [Anaerolineales bacterium]